MNTQSKWDLMRRFQHREEKKNSTQPNGSKIFFERRVWVKNILSTDTSWVHRSIRTATTNFAFLCSWSLVLNRKFFSTARRSGTCPWQWFTGHPNHRQNKQGKGTWCGFFVACTKSLFCVLRNRLGVVPCQLQVLTVFAGVRMSLTTTTTLSTGAAF